MPVLNRIAALSEDMATWRRHLHQHPELGQECHETAAYVVERLREFGVDEIHEGIAVSGVVGIINGTGPGPTLALRADMDALPIAEASGAEWTSHNPGKMHACGHDGHTTMLLGAARYLAETRNFPGRVALIFQPAEETGGGAELMVEEGVIERFDISEAYALHNMPGTGIGQFYTTPGPIMAAADEWRVDITGQGGHAAYPHECRDPVMAAVAIAQAFQTIVTRNNDPMQELVISVTMIQTGTTDNVIPDTAMLAGTVRTLDKGVRAMVRDRLQQIVEGQALSFGVQAELQYNEGFPPTINHPKATEFAAEIAREIAGEAGVATDAVPEMGAEDFSFFLEKVPGCYLFVGNGDSAGLHHPAYDFNDEAAPHGASFLARVAERALNR